MKIFPLLFFLVITASVNSQETWGPPFPLTDSLTDNVNATLSILPGDMIQPDTLYMLWERSSDTGSTGIYARNLTTMSGPFMVAAQPNAHFKHPRVFRRGYGGDTLFFFSYETDMNGNWDLYYSVLMKNESTLGPYPFLRSSQNERSLHFGSQESFSWEKEGVIYVKSTAPDTVVLAAENSANPVQSGEQYVAFEFPTGPNLGVFFSAYNYGTHFWDGPYPMDIYGTNNHLTFGNDSYGIEHGSSVLWQHKDGAYWEVKGFDLFTNQFCSFNNFPGCNNMSPSLCSINIITDNGFPVNAAFTTFSSDVSGDMEIYVNLMYDTAYSDISQYTGTDVHPQLFNNFHRYGAGLANQLFDIWESYRGGHWQLWATTMDILTGAEDLKERSSCKIKCYPNPSSGLTQIEYYCREGVRVVVEIFDLSGRKISMLKACSQETGRNGVTWDGRDASGNRVPAGIYICAVKTGESVLYCRITRR